MPLDRFYWDSRGSPTYDFPAVDYKGFYAEGVKLQSPVVAGTSAHPGYTANAARRVE